MKRVFVFSFFILLSVSALYAEASSGLTIYTLPGCSRCAYTLNYLKNNNINYTEYSTSDKAANKKMWEAIRASGKYTGGSITMPVVIINNQIYFNIQDLESFAGSINSLLAENGSSSGSNETPADTGSSFINNITGRHNYYRKNHSAPELKWNSGIQKFAQEWADKLASENRMYHRQPNNYGENIYWISGGSVTGSDAVDSWYSEIKNYNFNKQGFSMVTGHFTQVVWAGSTELGCGKARSKNGGIFVVCNYNPPGNYLGRFEQNVFPVNASGGNSNNDITSLPLYINIWTNGTDVANQKITGWMKKKLPIANHYDGADNGVYIAVYSHNLPGSIYSAGEGIYVMGLIRVKGNWNGRIAEPEGWEGQDISASDTFKKLAIKYFPACTNDGWVGGDTGGFFGMK